MMQMTRAAFQAVVSLNEQATDPKSHTLVRITYTLSSPVLSPANSDGRPCSSRSLQKARSDYELEFYRKPGSPVPERGAVVGGL